MSADDRCYLDTSALAKWYLNEPGSEAFVSYLQEIDVAIISPLVATELRSLLARRRRMGEISQELESVCARQSLGKEDDVSRNETKKTFHCDPSGASPEPERTSHPPEPSVAGAADKATSLAR